MQLKLTVWRGDVVLLQCVEKNLWFATIGPDTLTVGDVAEALESRLRSDEPIILTTVPITITAELLP